MTDPAKQTAALPAESAKRRWRVSRRGLLIGAGATGATLALGAYFGQPVLNLRMAEMLDDPNVAMGAPPADPDIWLEVLPDSRIRLYVPKVEMGQGVHTAIAQAAAEELHIAWEDLDIQQATTAIGPPDASGTGGSTSVSSTYLPVRQAAATLHYLLRQEAAQRLQEPPGAIDVQGRGFAVNAEPARRLDFHELVANRSEWEIPEEGIELTAEADLQVIGQSVPRRDIPAKVTGEAIYGYDVRLPNMRYGAVARPPTIEGKMRIAWPNNARTMPGVDAVVVDAESGFAGVVASSRAQARAALNEMSVEWDEGRLWQQSEIETLIQPEGPGGVVIQDEGDAPAALRQQLTHTAEYRTPLAVQTPLEPQAAVADVQRERVRVWASTQGADILRDRIADALRVSPQSVEIIPTLVGGGFGRKIDTGVAVEAARLSQAAGVPVHVGWDRSEELRHGYFRPPTHSKLYASMNEAGHIVALEHRQGSSDVAFGFIPGFLQYVFGADFGSWRGSRVQYNIANRKVTAWRRQLPLWTGWWRGLGLLANTFAIESFIDELAHLAGADPLQFRLAHLADDFQGRRTKAVLQAAADIAGWSSPTPEGRGRGLAMSVDVDTIVAQVAEISLDTASGKIRVHQVACAMDCGKVINPDGARAQVEGNVMWGVGSTLIEQVQIENGRVALDNFDTYPLLTLQDAPHVETVLLEAGDGKPRGVGEPPIGPVAAAIGNAFYALTGKRIRELPFTPARVLSVLNV